MRLLILISLIYVFNQNIAQANWVKKSAVKAPSTIYTKQSLCQQVESEVCIDISGKDLRHFKAGFRAIDILQTADCLNSADCQSQIDSSNFGCSPDVATFDDKVNWPLLDFAAESRPSTGFFLWCEKEILVADAAGKIAADAADAASAADQSTRDGAKGPRETSLQACVQDSKNPTLTPDQIKTCIAALVREVLGDKVAVPDL